MDEDSFDPRSWARKSGTTPPPPPPGAEPDPPTGQTTPASAERTSPLPDAWREIGADLAAGTPAGSPPPPPHSPTGSAAAGPNRALVASALLLLAGAGTAWLTRGAPPVSPGPIAAPSATPTPGAIERRLVLADVSDIAGALIAAGVNGAEAQAAAQAAAGALTARGEIHARLQLMPGDKGLTLQHLQISSGDGSGAVVNRGADGRFAATAVAAELARQIKVLRGELDTDSFYSSAVAAGLVDTLIPEFINAFSYDFNLASEVSPGDTFEVAYMQSVDASGNVVGQPQLLFASLTTKAKSLALYRFEMPGGEVGWYDGNGASTKRGLMRTPVDGARITSKFGMRFHPVLQYNKMHKGVDFAAPIGTPIYAAKDGTVLWAAMKGPNGNLTILQHDKDMQTFYLHQSMFMPGVTAGAHVTQGQKIGEIGTTGRSTGPHLHFEVHLANEPVDPLSIQSDDAERKRLEGDALQRFIAQRNRIDVARAQQVS